MTEQDIVKYLKQNKEKGVAFAFMPEEVKAWCEKNKDKQIFKSFNDYDWGCETGAIHCYGDYIYTLSENYEVEPETEKIPFCLKEQIMKSIDRRFKACVSATAMTHRKIKKHIYFGIAVELEDLKNEIESMFNRQA